MKNCYILNVKLIFNKKYIIKNLFKLIYQIYINSCFFDFSLKNINKLKKFYYYRLKYTEEKKNFIFVYFSS